MPRYIISYIGGDAPATPEAGQRHFARYREWLASLGEAALVPMAPYRDTRTITPDGEVSEGSAAGLSGHTLVEAPSLQAALALAQGCPFLDIQGTLEVAELVEMGAPEA